MLQCKSVVSGKTIKCSADGLENCETPRPERGFDESKEEGKGISY